MTLAQAPDRRITRHHADGFLAHRDQSGSGARARCCVGGLCTCMAAADHNDIECIMFHVKHPSLTNAELRKNLAKNGFYIYPADQRVKRANRVA